MTPNDKPQQDNNVFEDPKLFVTVGGEKFPRPALETAFAGVDGSGLSSHSDKIEEDDGRLVGGAVCACNKVSVSTRKRHATSPWYDNIKRRESSSSSGGSRSSGGGCRCAPVH